MNRTFIKEVGQGKWLVRTLVRQANKRFLRRDQLTTLPNGAPFCLPRHSAFASEIYITRADVDWGSEALLRRMLNGRGCFLDVGANIGYYAVYMHDKVDRTFAFEPDPRSLPALRVNVTRHANIEIVPAAVSDTPRQVEFMLEEQGEVSHIAQDGSPPSGRTLRVDAISIDSFVESRKIEVAAIKTDVEGHDFHVLEGASRTIAKQRPLILTEAEPTPALFSLASSADYAVYAYVRDPQTRKKQFAAVELDSAQCTKMLFLTPAERAQQLLAAA